MSLFLYKSGLNSYTINAFDIVNLSNVASEILQDQAIANAIASVAVKADITYVDYNDGLKANLTYVNSQISGIHSSITSNVNTLALAMSLTSAILEGNIAILDANVNHRIAANVSVLNSRMGNLEANMYGTIASNVANIYSNMANNVNTVAVAFGAANVAVHTRITNAESNLNVAVVANLNIGKAYSDSLFANAIGAISSNVTRIDNSITSNISAVYSSIAANVSVLNNSINSNVATINSQLSNKLNLTGGSISGDLTLATPGQSNIYFGGSGHGFIRPSATNALKMYTTSGGLYSVTYHDFDIDGISMLRVNFANTYVSKDLHVVGNIYGTLYNSSLNLSNDGNVWAQSMASAAGGSLYRLAYNGVNVLTVSPYGINPNVGYVYNSQSLVTRGQAHVGYTAQAGTEMLAVNGAIQIDSAISSVDGTIQYSGGIFQFRESGAWKNFASIIPAAPFVPKIAAGVIFASPLGIANASGTANCANIVHVGTGEYQLTFDWIMTSFVATVNTPGYTASSNNAIIANNVWDVCIRDNSGNPADSTFQFFAM